ncbi:MAG: hypothetical protein CMP28_10985 [Roseibacillus sp.]|nr:hypothetical protein [Roseibacillus sp.]
MRPTLVIAAALLSHGSWLLRAQEEAPIPAPFEIELQAEGDIEGQPEVQVEIPDLFRQRAGANAPGFLGVNAAELPAALADQLQLDHGVRLTEVNPDSPAGRAGLQVEDIILGVDDKKIGNMLQLREAITARRQGDEVTLKLVQKGKRLEKKVTLAGRPALPQIVIPPGAFQGGGIQIIPPGAGIQRFQRFGIGGDGGRFKMGDDDGAVEMKGEGESREVTVWDLSKKVVYEGPWVTPQDKAAPPDKVRKRIERVEKMFAGRAARRVRPFVLPQQAPNPPPPRPGILPKVQEDPRPKGGDDDPGP